MTKTEQRKVYFTNSLINEIQRSGIATIAIHWNKSPQGELNPQVYDPHEGAPCLRITGCGYCKLSTALSQILRGFIRNEASFNIRMQNASGTGVEVVNTILEDFGWKTQHINSSPYTDIFLLSTFDRLDGAFRGIRVEDFPSR